MRDFTEVTGNPDNYTNSRYYLAVILYSCTHSSARSIRWTVNYNTQREEIHFRRPRHAPSGSLVNYSRHPQSTSHAQTANVAWVRQLAGGNLIT